MCWRGSPCHTTGDALFAPTGRLLTPLLQKALLERKVLLLHTVHTMEKGKHRPPLSSCRQMSTRTIQTRRTFRTSCKRQLILVLHQEEAISSDERIINY